MLTAFEQLAKILELEAQRGYKNDAVVGGLGEYARQWRLQVVADIDSRDTADRVDHIAQLLSDYPRLPHEARASTIRHLQESVAVFGGRNAKPRERRITPEKASKPGAPPAVKSTSSPPRLPASSPPAPATGLDAPLTTLHGVGPSLAAKLARLDLHLVGDLLWHLPHRYQDYSNLRPIAQLQIGEEVTVHARVTRLDARKTTGQPHAHHSDAGRPQRYVAATFWNPYVERSLHSDREYYFSGRVGVYLGKRVLESPEFEEASDDPTHTARIVPIYPLTEGLSARVLRNLIREAVETWAPRLPDPLPSDLRQRLGYPALGDALRQVHFPDSDDDLDLARKRLAFDELLVIQLGVLGQHRAWQSKPAQPLTQTDAHLQAFLAALPFQLTRAQQRVLSDVRRDLTRSYPMTRLLQGDVGSGKTVIAAAAMWAAIGNGAQAALMAPTEILAEQHFRKFKEMFARLLHPRTGWPLRVELLTGSITGKRREELLAALASGDVDILLGTHALIQEAVSFHNLAVVVVDEQHRFGVQQRAALRDKGAAFNPSPNGDPNTPHTLVMSATPIPRTLALTIYGDMDVSAIDELPPGRQPIKTYWVKPDARARVYNFIRSQAGRRSAGVRHLPVGG